MILCDSQPTDKAEAPNNVEATGVLTDSVSLPSADAGEKTELTLKGWVNQYSLRFYEEAQSNGFAKPIEVWTFKQDYEDIEISLSQPSSALPKTDAGISGDLNRSDSVGDTGELKTENLDLIHQSSSPKDAPRNGSLCKCGHNVSWHRVYKFSQRCSVDNCECKLYSAATEHGGVNAPPVHERNTPVESVATLCPVCKSDNLIDHTSRNEPKAWYCKDCNSDFYNTDALTSNSQSLKDSLTATGIQLGDTQSYSALSVGAETPYFGIRPVPGKCCPDCNNYLPQRCKIMKKALETPKRPLVWCELRGCAHRKKEDEKRCGCVCHKQMPAETPEKACECDNCSGWDNIIDDPLLETYKIVECGCVCHEDKCLQARESEDSLCHKKEQSPEKTCDCHGFGTCEHGCQFTIIGTIHRCNKDADNGNYTNSEVTK